MYFSLLSVVGLGIYEFFIKFIFSSMDLRMLVVIHGLRADLQLEIFVDLRGQWVFSSSVVLFIKLE